MTETEASSKDAAHLNGVLVVDKPKGPTSHDVVARLRKLLGTRAIGHAGTLDPAASGVLVIAIGQATKLAFYLTAQEKRYEATVTFGRTTTTLDSEGDIVATGSIPAELANGLDAWAATAGKEPVCAQSASVLENALARERERREQIPPAFSAIQKDGRRAHELARRGEPMLLAPRSVRVRNLEVVGTSPGAVHLSLVVSKGYYVRALARDLGETLNVPAHLSALRRVASGSFTLEEALPLSAARQQLWRAVQPLARTALRVLPESRLSEEGTRRARHGQPLSNEHFVSPPTANLSAWLDPAGELIAVGTSTPGGGFAVERGFNYSTSSTSS